MSFAGNVCVCVCASCCCRRRLAGLVASDTSFARSSSSSSSSFWQGMGTYRVAIRPLHARQCLLGIGKRKKEHFTCSRTLQEKEKTAKLLIYFISFHLLRTFFFHFFFFSFSSQPSSAPSPCLAFALTLLVLGTLGR